MERYVCIHGHFYQPPRENPWLEAIEFQDTAYPYHDWNERITADCYEPNATSRILDEQGRIVHITNNYTKVSFNFGPTLLAWLEEKAPEVYKTILEVDRESQKTFSGHGSALAQAYNHVILPLANRHDKYTQVLWGIRDFEHRFGRKPEGMWLPETAVDLETLEIMAELGLKFTILAQRQASRVRRIGSRSWRDVCGGRIDPTQAYQLRLRSGRKISLFFYDEPIARAVAFEGLLASGEAFAQRVNSAFSEERTWPQLVHIATDGETYGHHHRHGDMALAYALHYIRSNNLAQITNYGEYLEKHPPTHEVEIIQNTSWSCAHGIERWRSNCGCNSGQHPGWSQAWRAPLRQALDWLRDGLAPAYEKMGRQFLKDPWAARNDYIAAILDRSPESLDRFLGQHAAQELTDAEKVTVLKLLELQRHAMLMFTSCGWFFDELSGIETVQILQYAGRAVQLAQELFGDDIEPRFLDLLEAAKSNHRQHGDGRGIYRKFVKPATVDLTTVAAHYAVSSLFEDYSEQAKIYCYRIDAEDYRASEAGRSRLALGRARVSSQVTQESAVISFGVLHFGDHNLNAGVRGYRGEEAYQAMVQEMTQAFRSADFAEVIRLLDRHFGISTYSLKSLFRDEQRRVLSRILESTLSQLEASYRSIYEQHYPLMRFLADTGNPLPRAFQSAAEFILNIDLRRAFGEEMPRLDRVQALLEAAGMWRVELDIAGLKYTLEQTIERLAREFRAHSGELSLLQRLDGVVSVAHWLPFDVNFRKAQNAYYDVLQAVYPQFKGRAGQGEEGANDWTSHFRALGQKLRVRVE